MPNAVLGLGANLPSPMGQPAETMAAALGRLAALGCLTAVSSLYSTAPVGLAEQPRFLNAVALLETQLGPLELLHQMLAIEAIFGRNRSAEVRNGPRTLDLDLLLYDGLCLDHPELQLPHPRLADRAFVLVPLAEVAPQRVDPRSGLTVATLLDQHARSFPGAIESVERLEFPRIARTEIPVE